MAAPDEEASSEIEGILSAYLLSGRSVDVTNTLLQDILIRQVNDEWRNRREGGETAASTGTDSDTPAVEEYLWDLWGTLSIWRERMLLIRNP
ncbi:hypothetical protein BV898_13872 [Hypsibius exemplaris]|uniref:Uncharacterized protein n=1 Tax=Hypsibius exemplaris TaxID=2072580 RepID=A0A1W0W9D9_HYPEX|nr:hypothetical protein BV898_13872 [Hypsibius exemplaris]